jgi:sulfite exporter TauE/SafE
LQAVTAPEGTFLSFFALGLFGGTTHCAVMCGPFVLAQVCDDNRHGRGVARLGGAALLPYHFGRATTYVTLGILFSTILNLAFLFTPERSLLVVPMLLLAALLFLVTAFPRLSSVFSWTGRIGLPAPVARISTLANRFTKQNSVLIRYFLGVVLGFIPCGLVLAALLAASATGDPGRAALAMAAFAAGTFPALFAVALGGKAIQDRYPETTSRLRRIVLVGNALWLCALAGIFAI